MTAPLLQVQNVSRSFPGVKALSDVSFSVEAGEVHALVGENGAGKSTLLSIMNGLLQPDEGQILAQGEPLTLGGPADAIAHRLAMVHQELVLCPNLTVAENVFLGREKAANGESRSSQGVVARTQALIDEIKVDLDPNALVGDLSLNERQIVEICRALSSRPKVIVFDEPTASLDDEQTEHLLEIIRKLRQSGLGIVYVSHRLSEIFAISDRITVLRDGRVVGTTKAKDITEQMLVSMMVGREYDPSSMSYRERKLGEVALEATNLTSKGHFAGVSFRVRKGEILGIAGLLGCQREAVVRAIFGALPVHGGSIEIHGRPVRIGSPRQAIDQGISFMPADRKDEGLVLDMSVEDNLCLTVLDSLSAGGLLRFGKRRELTRSLIARLATKVSSRKQPVRGLSGGNQQKVVIGKWLARKGDIVIAEDPTRGVDIGAKAEIWSVLQEMASEGKAIILIASELEELLGACDRIIAMNRGRVTSEYLRKDFDAEAIAHSFVA